MPKFTKDNFLEQSAVSVSKVDSASYPKTPPYHPDQVYPEYLFDSDSINTKEKNQAYTGIRNVMHNLGFDDENFGNPSWNPLGDIISPGNTVVIKPNAVMHINFNGAGSVFASITHGSVMRAIVDYAYIALKGTGRIVIADAPLAHSDFEIWKKITGMEEIRSWYRVKKNFEIEVYDLRTMYAPWDYHKKFSPHELRQRAMRDPAGYKEVDLGPTSEFVELSEEQCRKMYGSDYDQEHTIRHHTGGHHRYKVAQTFLDADVIISVPKLKTHMKVGVTLNIKSMVGTQGDKNYIPHCRIGDPSRGGDEYPDLGILQNTLNRWKMWNEVNILSKEKRWADALYRHILSTMEYRFQGVIDRIGKWRLGDKYIGNITGGSWYGNDTAWRMSLDLMRIILYTDRNGKLQNKPQRILMSFIDGIIAGDGEGPLRPSDKKASMMIGSLNPLVADIAGSTVMGFDWMKIPTLRIGLTKPWLNSLEGSTNKIEVRTDNKNSVTITNLEEKHLSFKPTKGWKNMIELESRLKTNQL